MIKRNGKNIVLIGMPGVGKSTVGVLLAKRVGYSFLDTDIYIQTQEGKSLQALIQQHGTSGFCDIEARYMTSISVKAHVLATGGSVIYRPQAMKHFKTTGVVIHLDIELARLKKRLDDLSARGVVIAPGLTLGALYAERQPLYAKYADATIKTDGLSPDQVVRELSDILIGSY
jgi:shikimate kinase